MAVPPTRRVAARMASAVFERVTVPAVDFFEAFIQFVPLEQYCHKRGKWNPRPRLRRAPFCVAIWRELGSKAWMSRAVISCYSARLINGCSVILLVNKLLTNTILANTAESKSLYERSRFAQVMRKWNGRREFGSGRELSAAMRWIGWNELGEACRPNPDVSACRLCPNLSADFRVAQPRAGGFRSVRNQRRSHRRHVAPALPLC